MIISTVVGRARQEAAAGAAAQADMAELAAWGT
jgi:hypothetical protein